jgi:hypothetical protein
MSDRVPSICVSDLAPGEYMATVTYVVPSYVGASENRYEVELSHTIYSSKMSSRLKCDNFICRKIRHILHSYSAAKVTIINISSRE